MRKQLLIFLSALGLAGCAITGTAQVIKGADSPAAKAETQQKTNNNGKSVLIGLSQPSDATRNRKKSDKGVLIGLSQPSDATRNRKKSDKGVLIGLSQPSDATRNRKKSDKGVLIGLSQPSDANKKLRKAGGGQQLQSDHGMGDGSVRNASSAAQNEAKKKADQASPKF